MTVLSLVSTVYYPGQVASLDNGKPPQVLVLHDGFLVGFVLLSLALLDDFADLSVLFVLALLSLDDTLDYLAELLACTDHWGWAMVLVYTLNKLLEEVSFGVLALLGLARLEGLLELLSAAVEELHCLCCPLLPLGSALSLRRQQLSGGAFFNATLFGHWFH